MREIKFRFWGRFGLTDDGDYKFMMLYGNEIGFVRKDTSESTYSSSQWAWHYIKRRFHIYPGDKIEVWMNY